MFPLITILVATLPLVACSFTGPVQQVGPNTYSISHSMSLYSPVKGVRNDIVARGHEVCAAKNMNYVKVREEVIPAENLTYTLTFNCSPVIADPTPKTKNKI